MVAWQSVYSQHVVVDIMNHTSEVDYRERCRRNQRREARLADNLITRFNGDAVRKSPENEMSSPSLRWGEVNWISTVVFMPLMWEMGQHGPSIHAASHSSWPVFQVYRTKTPLAFASPGGQTFPYHNNRHRVR